MATKILFLRGKEADMPLLDAGQAGFALDSGKLFIGTGLANVVIGNTIVPDGDYGDIDVTDGGETWTIKDNVVELECLATIATQTVLGRATAGFGNVQSLSWLTILAVLANTTNAFPFWNGSTWSQVVPGAAANSVLTSQGAAPNWRPIATYAFEESQTSGTAGGTFTAGSWVTRVLNTTVVNSDGGATLAANQVTIPAGVYVVRARAPGVGCNLHQTRLRNVSDSTTIAMGSNAFAQQTAPPGANDSIIYARFTIGSAKAIAVEHQCQTTQATFGLGGACSFGNEIYTQIQIERVP